MHSPSDTWQVAGRSVPVTHLDMPYWPEDAVTKRDLLHYYRRLAPVILPYFQDRPVTLRVFPDGVHGASYYRRDRPEGAPAWLRSATYRPPSSGHVLQLVLVDDAAGLVWLANQGSIEFHLWGSRLPDLSQPDQAIFDLDPGEEATFSDVLRAALHLRETLERLGLRGYPKTSGGQGLHVYLPLAPGHSYAGVRGWVKAVAAQLATAHPAFIAVARGPTHRGRHVTVDYAQNSIGRNTAAPYTVRARLHAPVSTPLSWAEVEDGAIHPSELTWRVVSQRLEQVGDLFAPVRHGNQHLPR